MTSALLTQRTGKINPFITLIAPITNHRLLEVIRQLSDGTTKERQNKMKKTILTLMTGILFLSVHTQLSAQPRQTPPLVIPGNVTIERDIVYLEAGDYVDKNDPPTLIFHGEEDYFVIISQSEMLYDALKKAGATTKLVRVANGGHGYKPTPEGSVVKPSRNEMNALELQWFRKYLKHPQ